MILPISQIYTFKNYWISTNRLFIFALSLTGIELFINILISSSIISYEIEGFAMGYNESE